MEGVQPEISVIIPVYNISEYLPRFFESLIAQSFQNFCAIVVDDGSTDNSAKVCREYSEKDNRIIFIQKEHEGVIVARNVAMQAVNTPFTVFADGDDYLEINYLKNLYNAQKEYNADLVISRVVYRSENDLKITGMFPARGTQCISKEMFPDMLPGLLDDRRLNYLYGKIYRTELLKNISVPDDVRQGSDTMITCQYIGVIASIVIIDDLDYNYIKYTKRSITSYKGDDAFLRLCRINEFIYKTMDSLEYLNEKMVNVIDGRVLVSAIWVIDTILASNNSLEKQYSQITGILNNEMYLVAYKRQEKFLKNYSFTAIKPQSGKRYICSIKRAEKRAEKRNVIKAKIRNIIPKGVIDIYHKVGGNK